MELSFNKGRNNEYEVFNHNRKIGGFELLFEKEKYWLNKIYINEDCKQKAYASEIIKNLTETYSPFRISLSGKNAHNKKSPIENDSRYLTCEGFILVKSCFRKGILHAHHFEFPFDEILVQYQSDRFLNNRNLIFLNLLNRIIIKTSKGFNIKNTFDLKD